MLQGPAGFQREIEEAVRDRVGGAYAVLRSGDGFWIALSNGRDLPDQGWKLHVSAGVACAPVVLRIVLPILLDAQANFKVAADMSVLATLNGGFGGAFQIGKFITVYPTDDDEAVRLARLLDQSTRGLVGPRVPTDRRIADGSLVSYRYGAFSGRAIRNSIGETLPAMLDVDGRIVLDVRKGTFDPPAWAVDPFAHAGLGEGERPSTPLIAGRFFVLQVLHRSARGSVLFAIDIETKGKVVLKQASAADEIGNPDLEARSGIRREHVVLSALYPRAQVARPISYLTSADSEYLVMEYQSAVSLEDWMRPQILEGRLPSFAVIRDLAIQVADFLLVLHQSGYVYGDLKSANVLVGEGERLIFLDFELAMPPGATLPPDTGTRGYLSKARRAGLPTSASDDLYALGALTYFLATGAEPSQAPLRKPLLTRPIGVMRPSLSAAQAARIADFVGWCTGDGAERGNAEDARSRLLAWTDEVDDARQTDVACSSRPDPRKLAFELGASLLRKAKNGANGPNWISRHPLALGVDVGDWNTGSAGVIMAINALAEVSESSATRPFLHSAATALSRFEPLPGDPVGLYVGAAGRAVALMRAGITLEQEPLVDAGEALMRGLDPTATDSPDLFNGRAGLLRAQLAFYLATGGVGYLNAAQRLGQQLIKVCIRDERGARWFVPAGHAALSGQVYLGYAHGAAGIGDALLDLWELTRDADLADCIRSVVTLYERSARQVGTSASGLNWPSQFDVDSLAAAYWCHGAAGITQFLLRVHGSGLDPRAAQLSRGGLEATSDTVRWSRPTPCHGLAGAIDTLLDGFRTFKEERWLHAAQDLHLLLESFVIDSPDGTEIETEAASDPTTDFMLGYAGIIPVLLRLSAPSARQSFLSLHGLTDRAAKQSEGA